MTNLLYSLIFLLAIVFFSLVAFRTKLKRNLEIIYVFIFFIGYAAKISFFSNEGISIISFVAPTSFLLIFWVGFITGFQLRYNEIKKIIPRFVKIYFLYHLSLALIVVGILYLLGLKNKILILSIVTSFDSFITRKLLKNGRKFVNTVIYSTLTAIISLLILSFHFRGKQLLFSIVIGIGIAVILDIFLFEAKKELEFFVVFLALILLFSSLSFMLNVSSVITSFLAGLFSANITMKMRNRILVFLQSGEHIILFLLLFLSGYYFNPLEMRFLPLIILFASMSFSVLFINKRFNLSIYGINPLSLAILLEFFLKSKNISFFSTMLGIYIAALITKGSIRLVYKKI